MAGPEHDYDVLVIGSGFGGGVTALRASEKGYRVGVLEAGPDTTDPADLPETTMQVRKFFFMPRLGMRGIFRLTLLRNVLVFSGAGVGGGSLVYANTLYRPPDAFYADPRWADITDWEAELGPCYDQAERMLGVTDVPFLTEPDRIMRDIAEDMGVGHTFRNTRVGVWFGSPGEEVADPYFGGEGPTRTGCIRCGDCMAGCKHNAKNTVDKNYLWLARTRGVSVHANHEVVDVRPLADGGYEVVSRTPGRWFRHERSVHTAEQVVVSASALGTAKLLHRLKERGSLPRISDRLGFLSRTNSEAIVGAEARRVPDDIDLSRGVAIGSSFHPDEHTHVEPVRYGPGSNINGLLTSLLVDGGGRVPRGLRWLGTVLRHPLRALRALSVRRWSERAVIVLVMQTLDNSLTTFRKKGIFGSYLTSRQGHGEPNPSWIPVANDVARTVAERIDGHAMSSASEAILDIPSTAHFIGGCTIAEDPSQGVIDPYHRVFGHPGLHIIDGSAVTANLGVNPSLTITAMSERAMSLWPNKGDEDQRPALGEPYRRLAPVAPRSPVVPADAPGAYRLPIVEITSNPEGAPT